MSRAPLAILLCLASVGPAPAAAPVCRPTTYDESIYPPWQKGANNDAAKRGLEFTVPQADVMADFHGDLTDPKLVLYVGGNYFFAMAPLVKAFEAERPEYKGKLFWETIPPGLLVDQLKAGGTVTSGNLTFTAKGDVYLAGQKKVRELVDDGLLEGPVVSYVSNTLAIMVPKDNPAHVAGLADLGKQGVRLVMPNPAFEGIAAQINAALEKAGGPALAKAVYDTKVADGSTILTHIHHRQSPLFLMQGCADAGVTWRSEAIFQEQVGHAIAHIEIPAGQNATGIYAGAVVKGAAHPQAAKAWLEFIRSPTALKIFEGYGFRRYTDGTP
ncbi:Glycine/betaine ABC transporter substrate-binding protein [Beijerinckiaceae bacterium RH AL1]|nr:substrate-binding domain-containing protein [Beijerinckiaceae bacterium]VVB49453.1 Glycine/betaine ABC transporter substrate-binding protein [Beijerinckiaceae bacterium RH CH11]VVB49534.1 Glycine/betaine ABC transporter substrate-binding protein [Beijerinckiaceae bacterium RH AL8]VVC56910.1 Glycine/betaine ABC transporter substrate-binding protein [Beijerinckiaceae bacterium RH AL1]